MRKKGSKAVFNKHHVVYGGSGNKEIVRNIRKGVHFAITVLRRFSWLTDEEIETVKVEAELMRRFSHD